MPEGYLEFAVRLSNLEVIEYVSFLEQQANAALQMSPVEIQQQAKTAFFARSQTRKGFLADSFQGS